MSYLCTLNFQGTLMNKDLVSVIMPTFNAGKFLSSSIDSILTQTYTNLELLITDDASTDPMTISTLKDYAAKDARVKVKFLEKNSGPGYARNDGIRRAQGRYIAFCDSDDRWFPDKLEKQLALMLARDCALVCSSYIICDDDDKETGINMAPPRISFQMMKRDNKIGCSTAIYDIQKLGEKYYMPDLRKRQDWALFLNILKKCRMAYGIEYPLAYYRNRRKSVSSNKFSLVKYNIRVYEKVLGFSKPRAYLYFLFLFLPTYYIKIHKRNMDSKRYLESKKHTIETQ